MKLTKKRKQAATLIQEGKSYSVVEASALVKNTTTCKFDASVDLHIRLGIDPKKADQSVRGTVSLPNGTGKTKKALVLCLPEKEEEAKNAGADFYGLAEYVEKIEKGWLDVDIVIATPSVMPKIAKLGKILGPRNLMPNPKSGTVTENIKEAVNEIKKGKIAFRVDKEGMIHTSIGRVSFPAEKIAENAEELIHMIARLKPSSAKGNYFKSIYMASTMSPGIAVDIQTIKGI